MKNYLYLADGSTTTSTTNFEPAVYILFSIVIIVVLIGLTVLVALSVFKSMKKDKLDAEINTDEEDFVSSNKMISAMDEFAKRYRFDNEMSLYYFSIDDFGSIRKSFGSKQADKFLHIILKRAKDVMPKNSLIAEVGIDKYAILVRGRVPVNKIELFIQQFIKVLGKPIFIPEVDDGKISISVSVGCAIYPASGSTSSELLKKADMALYKATNDSSKQYVIIAEDTEKSTNENIEYYKEIREAMRNNEFTCNYQPMIDIQNNKLLGAEVLVRWVHPTLGILSPAKFLNIMEHTGDIVWVGKWELENICTQITTWKKSYPNLDFFISLNISPRQLSDNNIYDDFTSIVKRYKVNPNHICLEVVEFALFEKYSNMTDTIARLHDFGFKIAIDDFNLNGNSLGRLATLPIDIVKVEKSFVETARGNYMMDKVCHMLVDYGKTEGKVILAEGVENEEVLAEIMNYGLSSAQGYLFSRPLTKADFEKYMQEEPWKDAINNAIAKKQEVAEAKENRIISSDDEL